MSAFRFAATHVWIDTQQIMDGFVIGLISRCELSEDTPDFCLNKICLDFHCSVFDLLKCPGTVPGTMGNIFYVW